MRYVFLVMGTVILGGIWFMGREESIQPTVTSEIPSATINGHVLVLEVVKTSEEQSRGLSGSGSLAANAGMLFVYETPSIPGFWMKEMNFPIDIIWIGSDRRIVDITENLAPETFPQVFYPRSPIQYVLEVNANWASDHSISVGYEAILYGIL